MTLRRIGEGDWKAAEELTRRAFYNIYEPGCVEHYLVHLMPEHEDFLPAPSLVAEEAGRLVGLILYTRSWLVDETGRSLEIATFGPIAVDVAMQRRGLGKRLIAQSLAEAEREGVPALVIFGYPSNYVSSGFVSARKLGIATPDGRHPAAMLAKELVAGALSGHEWTYHQSPVMDIDTSAAEAFDASLPVMEKRWMPSQEEFWIMSRSTLD